MHEHGAPFGRRHSASSSSTSGSPRTSGTKLDPESAAGRAASRRQGSRAGGGRSGRGSPLASSSHHNQHAAAAAAAEAALDAAAVADRLGARATVSAAAAVHVPAADNADRAPQPELPATRRAYGARLHFAGMKNAFTQVVEFMQTLAKNARDPVAVGDALLWLVLLPLEAMRRTARSPGAVALLRVTLEATAELLVAAMLAGAAICVTALHVLTEEEAGGGGGDSGKRNERAQPQLPGGQSPQPESPLPVDAAGERCSPRSVLSSPLPTSLH